MFQPLSLFVGLRYSVARDHSFFVSFITWVSMLGLCLGVAALIVIISVMNGFESELRSRLLSLAAHATVTSRAGAMEDWPTALAALQHAPGVIGAAPYIDIDAMLTRSPSMSGAIVRGIDPKLEGQVSAIGGAMRQGQLDDLRAGSYRMVLGRALAYQLEAGVGDEVTVMIPSRAGSGADLLPRIQQFKVSGIFEVGLQDHDSVLALVSLADAENLRGSKGPSGIRLKFSNVMAAPQWARSAAAGLGPGFVTRDWTEENAAYFHAIGIEKGMMSIILLLVVAVAAFNIVAALVMVVNDKRTDIAILRTLGATPGSVLAIFVTQGVLIGGMGTLFGVVLGLATALNVDVIVPFLERLFHFHIMDPEVYSIPGIPSETHSGDVFWITVAALLLTLIATIYPALRAARTQPAEALRYE
jgi:lipoprotein-releasing system permease protein